MSVPPGEKFKTNAIDFLTFCSDILPEVAALSKSTVDIG